MLKSKWNQELLGYLKSVSTLQTHEITNHESQKTKLLHLYYMTLLHEKFLHQEKNTLHKHSQNKYLFLLAFLFSFYFHTICRFCIPEKTNADNICKAI